MKKDACWILSGNKNTDGWVMCLEMKFYYETLLKGEWRAKHIMEGKDYRCWVTLHHQQSIRKWKEQQKIERDGRLQIEGECHKPGTNSRILNEFNQSATMVKVIFTYSARLWRPRPIKYCLILYKWNRCPAGSIRSLSIPSRLALLVMQVTYIISYAGDLQLTCRN